MRCATESLSSQTTQRGFTLIELMIVLVIVALFASISVPAFQDTISRNRRLTALDSTLAMLSTARTAAVTRDARIALCPSSNQISCSGSAWEGGIIVFVDDGAGTGMPGDLSLSGSEEILAVSTQISGGVTIRTANFTDTDGIGFAAGGMADQRGTLVVCGQPDAPAVAIILNISGQPRLASDDNGDGSVNDDQGNSVSC